MFVDLGCFSLILFSGKKFGINRFRWGDILYTKVSQVNKYQLACL